MIPRNALGVGEPQILVTRMMPCNALVRLRERAADFSNADDTPWQSALLKSTALSPAGLLLNPGNPRYQNPRL